MLSSDFSQLYLGLLLPCARENVSGVVKQINLLLSTELML